MIDIKQLNKGDIGRWVKYTYPIRSNMGGMSKIGRIKNYDDKYIYVVYGNVNKWTGKIYLDDFEKHSSNITNPDYLQFIDIDMANKRLRKISERLF